MHHSPTAVGYQIHHSHICLVTINKKYIRYANNSGTHHAIPQNIKQKHFAFEQLESMIVALMAWVMHTLVKH